MELKEILDYYSQDHSDSLNVNLTDSSKIIYGIQVAGNKQLSFRFIYNQIGLKPGDIFEVKDLESRISFLKLASTLGPNISSIIHLIWCTFL